MKIPVAEQNQVSDAPCYHFQYVYFTVSSHTYNHLLFFFLQNQETILNQLKEITGVQDAQALRHAYDASNGDITAAIGLLTDSANSASSNMCQPAQPTVTAPPADNNPAAAAATVPTAGSTRPKNKQGEIGKQIENNLDWEF